MLIVKNDVKFEYPPTVNNFDLIRLFAAIQVLILHVFVHFNLYGINPVLDFFFDNILSYFPGVPIFFFISGFLIFWSFDRNFKDVKKFYLNRILRIYPALWVCFLFTLFVLFSYSQVNLNSFLNLKFLVWIGAQLTFFQFWTPDILKNFGLGNPNGVLGTISVELQFYLIIPLIYKMIKKSKIYLLLIIFTSLLINYFAKTSFNHESFMYKIASVCIFSYLFYFCLGIAAFIYFHKFKFYLENYFSTILAVYVGFFVIFSHILRAYSPSYWPNIVETIAYLLLCCVTVSFAFNFSGLSQKILRNVDLSYGIYIYHGVLLNIFIVNRLFSYAYLILFMSISVLLACFSWFFVEKYFISLKNLRKNKSRGIV